MKASKKIAFIGGFADTEDNIVIKNHLGYLPYYSSDPLQKSIVNQISTYFHERIDVFNMIFYPSSNAIFYNKKTIVENEQYRKYNVPFLYCRVLVHFSKAINLFFALIHAGSYKNIIVYSTYYPFLLALKWYKLFFDVNIILIVPDLPEYIGLQNKESFYIKVSRFTRTHLFKKNNIIVDSYVLLTRQMNDVINKSNKPYCIVEGIAPSNYHYHIGLKRPSKKIVLYSGTLQYKYGILELINAIQLINEKDVSFVFYGDGEGKDLIVEKSKIDSRIVYGGILNREALNIEQQKATILINPRQNNNEFTKYSFPSKIIEYMLSGRPIVCYKLDGIPEEYDNYLVYPKDNSIQSLAKTISNLLNTDDSKLSELGLKGRYYVLKNKSETTQVAKIIKLLK